MAEVAGVQAKAGAVGSALTRAIASCNVAVTSVFGALEKPMWLSLIWAKVKSAVSSGVTS
jgi:hypothetical protein